MSFGWDWSLKVSPGTMSPVGREARTTDWVVDIMEVSVSICNEKDWEMARDQEETLWDWKDNGLSKGKEIDLGIVGL